MSLLTCGLHPLACTPAPRPKPRYMPSTELDLLTFSLPESGPRRSPDLTGTALAGIALWGFNSSETSCKNYRLPLISSISLAGFSPLCAHSYLHTPGIIPLPEGFWERSIGVGEWLKVCILMYKDRRWNGCPVRPRWGCGRKWGEILLTSAFQVSSTTSLSERGREQWLELTIALLPQI